MDRYRAAAVHAHRRRKGFDPHSTDITCPQCLGHLTASADVCWHCGLYDPTARKDPHA